MPFNLYMNLRKGSFQDMYKIELISLSSNYWKNLKIIFYYLYIIYVKDVIIKNNLFLYIYKKNLLDLKTTPRYTNLYISKNSYSF